MEKLTVEERSALVKLYSKHGSSIITFEAAFRRIYELHEAPSEHVMSIFRNAGNVALCQNSQNHWTSAW
jgi:hypothetical protein